MKMYINKISMIFLLSVLAVSCGKELDIEPGVNEVIQPDFGSVEDIETALFGVYSGFKSDRLYTSNILALGEWPADNLKIASQNVGFGAIIHEWDYTESFDTVEDTWVGLYDVIRRANFVIKAVDNYTGEEMDLALDLKAQALTLRSLALLDAHKIFSNRISDGSELSVVYVTDPDDILQQLPRISRNELFALLEADLDFALNNLWPNTDVHKVSQSFIYGLKARIALFSEDWQSVVANVDLALANSFSSLSTITNYGNMWQENDDDGEAIFKLALDSDDPNVGDLYFTDGVGPVFDPSADLFNLYGQDDIRLPSFYRQDAQFGVVIAKFYGPASQRGFHELFIMRLSELYLMKAEAHAELGQEAEALQSLDEIRSNRIASFGGGSETGDDLLQAIRLERRKELAFEGFRFSDLARWSQDVERGDCTADECFLASDDFKMIFPIPRAELFANDNMVQNPGY